MSSSKTNNEQQQQQQQQKTSSSSSSSVIISKLSSATGVALIRERWAQRNPRVSLTSSGATNNTDSADSSFSTTSSSEDFNVAREQHPPSAHESSGNYGLAHQSRSCPGNAASSRPLSRRTSVAGSQDLAHHHQQHHHHHDNANVQHQHQQRGSSPLIRAYGPDGRHHSHELLHAAASYPPSRGSRSPSPARAASLDTRGMSQPPSSPALSTSSSTRCLSPLLIPPQRASFCCSTPSHEDQACGGSNECGGMIPPASPLGAIQPDLYQRKDKPFYLEARRSGKSIGRLHLTLKYDFDKSDLNVHLIEAHNLAGSDQGGFNDPYIKLTLSPEVDLRKRQSEVHSNDPNPYYDQHFKFPVSHEQLQDKTLLLQVLDNDRFSRSDVVGSVRISLEDIQISSSASPIEVWGEIERERKPPEEIQEILISLSYLPNAEKLTLNVLEARNLFPSEGKESLDPYVKVALICSGNRGKKNKTRVKKDTRCPVWNESMSFKVPAASLASSAIEIRVVDSSSSDHLAIIGSCIVGPATGSTATTDMNPSKDHWLKMTHTPRKPISMWHILH